MRSELFTLVLCLGFSHAYIIDVEAFKEPPPAGHYAVMARYIVHVSDWIAISTISTQENITGYPFVTIKSVSDGPSNISSGIPYLYMTNADLSAQDLQKDNRVSIVATLAENDYCKQENYDQQNPRCPKVMITGRFKQVNKQAQEYKFGQSALFDRHPEMKTWPLDHSFYVSKIAIEKIYVLDSFGGAKVVSVSDYFKASPFDYHPDEVI